MKLGAKEFIATKDAKELKVSRPLDRLLVTTAVAARLGSSLLPIMAPGATIHPLSVAERRFDSMPYSEFAEFLVTRPRLFADNAITVPLILQGLTVQGSVVAARAIHKQMIDFSALHGIAPIIQKFPMTKEGITEAMDQLNNGNMRYRGVLIPQ